MPPDAKFCPECGKLIAGITSDAAGTATPPVPVIAKPRKLWLYVVGVLVVGTYAAMFLPAFAGRQLHPQSTFASVLWTGLFFYLWWRRRDRKGWLGALIGSMLGLLISVVAQVISRAA